jgi:hypothetical protein
MPWVSYLGRENGTLIYYFQKELCICQNIQGEFMCPRLKKLCEVELTKLQVNLPL